MKVLAALVFLIPAMASASDLDTLAYEDGQVMEHLHMEFPDEASPDFDFDPGFDSDDKIIGPDTRRRVTSTTNFPYRTVGRITSNSWCTGTLVGPRHVITAGHCVYDRPSKKWKSNVYFAPGQNGSKTPYGKVRYKTLLAPRGYVEKGGAEWDFAMIVLSEDIGSRTGWMAYGYDDTMKSLSVNIAGYPADKPRGQMWRSYCKVSRLAGQRLYYPCDTYGGMSGAAAYRYLNGERVIYGIHKGSWGSSNTGVRINKTVFEKIREWKRLHQAGLEVKLQCLR